jgi:hypothetical protein
MATEAVTVSCVLNDGSPSLPDLAVSEAAANGWATCMMPQALL